MSTFYLEEILGMGDKFDNINYSDIHPDITASQNPNLYKHPDYKSPVIDLSAWQRIFATRILNKQDSFISVPPGAGKTDPILYSWMIQFKAAHNIDIVNDLKPFVTYNVQKYNNIDKKSKEFPRLLYIGRTKQLSGEAFSQNIRGDDKYGLLKIILDNPEKFGRNPGDIKLNPDGTIGRDQESSLLNLINSEIMGLSAGSVKSGYTSSIYGIKPVYISTPSTGKDSALIELIRNYGDWFNTIIIDESQDYMIKPGEARQNKSDQDMFQLYLDVIRTAAKPGTCGVHLLTGTTNKQSVEWLKTNLNKCYKRNFDTIGQVQNLNDPKDPGAMFFSRDFDYVTPNNPLKGGMQVDNPTYNPNPQGNTSDTETVPLSDKYAANRANISVVPFDRMQTPQQKKELIIDIIKSNQKQSIIIIFGVNRNSKSGIFRLLEDVIPVLPAKDPSFFYDSLKSDPSKKTVADLKKQYGGNFISNPDIYNSNSQVTRDNGMVTDSNGKQVHLNSLDDIEFMKYFDVDKSERGEKDEIYSTVPNPNNLVYQAMLRGIGVMIGQSDSRHKEVTQKLFREGKLTLLLATDKKLSR